LVVEVDGGYHDYCDVSDASRQQKIEAAGWSVIRFTNDEVLGDVEAVATAIGNFIQRKTGPSP
jgi:very-short-patch-repair endonuclease